MMPGQAAWPAIEDANAATGADEIHFAKGVHGTIKLASDLPAITDSLTISGPGASRLIINGEQHQLFNVLGSAISVTISGVKLTGGLAEDGGALEVNDPGAVVVINKTVITGSLAIGDASAHTDGQGGGIEVSAGMVWLQSSNVTSNKVGDFETVTSPFAKPKLVFVPAGEGGGIDVAAGASLEVVPA